jgi:hypothetical protein
VQPELGSQQPSSCAGTPGVQGPSPSLEQACPPVVDPELVPEVEATVVLAAPVELPAELVPTLEAPLLVLPCVVVAAVPVVPVAAPLGSQILSTQSYPGGQVLGSPVAHVK